MTREEILEGNKLIAEFIGLYEEHRYINIESGNFCKRESDSTYLEPTTVRTNGKNQYVSLKYHFSWDWLIPVVEKIELLGYTTSFKTQYCRINPIEGLYYEHIVKSLWSGHTYRNLEDGVLPSKENNFHVLNIGNDTNPINKIEMIYLCVINFIKWYNETNNKE